MANPVFRKTDAGRAEIGLRQAGLSPVTRRVLILVKGREGVAALSALGLPDLPEHLALLRERGFIEPDAVPAPEPVPAAPLAAVAEPAAAPLASAEPVAAWPPEPSADEAEAVLGLQRQAFLRLRQHFGPDTATIAEAMLAARSLAQFRAAVSALEPRLSIHLGRREAAREVGVLRGG